MKSVNCVRYLKGIRQQLCFLLHINCTYKNVFSDIKTSILPPEGQEGLLDSILVSQSPRLLRVFRLWRWLKSKIYKISLIALSVFFKNNFYTLKFKSTLKNTYSASH
jgi:hypothetical protein